MLRDNSKCDVNNTIQDLDEDDDSSDNLSDEDITQCDCGTNGDQLTKLKIAKKRDSNSGDNRDLQKVKMYEEMFRK